MRKVILSIMAVAAISFSSCGNKTENGGDVDSTANEVEAVADSVETAEAEVENVISDLAAGLESSDKATVETKVAEAQGKIAQLIEEGKLDQAKAYAEKIQNFIKENKDKLNATGSTLVSSFVSSAEKLDLNNIEASAKDWASTVKAVAGEAGSKAVSDVEGAAKGAAQAVAGEAGQKVQDAVNKVEDAKAKVDAAKAKAEEAKQKIDNAPEAVKKAAEDAKNKAKEDLKNKANEEVSKGLNKLLGK